jgi:hypothetical protein
MLTPFAQRSHFFGPRVLPGVTVRRDSPAAPDIASVPTLHQELPRLAIELERARRHCRPLSVVLVSLDSPARLASDGVEASSELYPVLSVLLALTLRETLRQADIVSYVTAQSRCVVVLPETSGEGARAVVRRMRQQPSIALLSPLRTGLGVFPEDGWTFDAILGRADEDWTATADGGKDGVR